MLRSVFVFLCWVCWIAAWLLPIMLAHYTGKKRIRNAILRLVNRGMLRVAGVNVTIVGEMSAARPLLLVSNHLSYLDILVIGSVASVAFAPKAEIARWPFIGFFCRLMDCVFIDRSPRKIGQGTASLVQALQQPMPVMLFPEATTGDGRHLLPFKPAFFEAAVGGEIALQPVAIAYKKINGLPIDSGQWLFIAWYGDMALLPHLFTLLALGRIEVEVHFLPALEVAADADRKQLAHTARTIISHALTSEKLSHNHALLTKD